MNLLTVFLLAAGLSMDAFAISVTNGMCYKMPLLKNALYSGLAFGLFQGLMPLIGFFAGTSFSHIVDRYTNWLALLLLGLIGSKMIADVLKDRNSQSDNPPERVFSLKVLLLQGIATSIDALAVGAGVLSVMQVNIFTAVSIIAATTFSFSFAGVVIGKKAGGMLKEKAGILGGIILIATGLKIFLGD